MIKELLNENNVTLSHAIDSNTVLLETGLDSLSFAVLVVQLEEELGYDPFVLMKDPFYPKTYGEFVNLYEKYKEHRT